VRATTIGLTLTTAATALLLVSGCSSNTPDAAGPTTGAPTPTGGTGSTSSASPSGSNGGNGGGEGNSNLHGAPSIGSPMDTAKYQQSPCSALTSAQQQSLGFGQAGQNQPSQKGNVCIWNMSGSSGSYSVGFDDVASADDPAVGLADYYQHGTSGFTALPDIQGLPAIKVVKGDGQCQIVIGASNSVAFNGGVVLSPGNTGYRDPCGEAMKIATAAASTMKSGG
jgi:hypothetical protein